MAAAVLCICIAHVMCGCYLTCVGCVQVWPRIRTISKSCKAVHKHGSPSGWMGSYFEVPEPANFTAALCGLVYAHAEHTLVQNIRQLQEVFPEQGATILAMEVVQAFKAAYCRLMVLNLTAALLGIWQGTPALLAVETVWRRCLRIDGRKVNAALSTWFGNDYPNKVQLRLPPTDGSLQPEGVFDLLPEWARPDEVSESEESQPHEPSCGGGLLAYTAGADDSPSSCAAERLYLQMCLRFTRMVTAAGAMWLQS